MVRGENYTLHREQFNRCEFPSFVRIPGIECDFSPSGNGTIRDHAKQEAQNEDSKTATRTWSKVPTLVKLFDNRSVLVGFSSSDDIDAQRAECANESKAVMKGDIFEVGFDQRGELIKVCVRYPYDRGHDQIIALDLRRPELVTTWLNGRQDTHNTLNLDKYDSVDTVRSRVLRA